VYRGMEAGVIVVPPVELLYERAYVGFSAEVFRFLLAWTNDWSAAQDLTQEAYVRLWQHRHSLDWDRPVLPWLVVTARRLANNRFRTVRRRVIPMTVGGPSDETVRARWLDVKKAMSRLTALERTALILTAVEGWSYTEVGSVLGRTDGALRAAVSRAREKLEAA
jgi:RNA polymerase sigma-70 factor (ECF subfamily)